MAEKQRLVFMGTSAFAAQILAALANSAHEIAAIYTRADKPAGRGLVMRQSDVKALAVKLGISERLRQPVNFKSAEAVAELAALQPDFLVVASYGLILPQAVLDIPAIAPVNIHASLLPRYRGAAPIQRAIMENWQSDAQTGVSIMRMEAGLDTGPVYAMRPLLLSGETTPSLTTKLAAAGADLLLELLPAIAQGSLQPLPQDDSRASYAHKLNNVDYDIDWRQPALAIEAKLRALAPKGAKTTLRFQDGRETPIAVISGAIGPAADAAPGSMLYSKKGLAIACGDYWLQLQEIIPQGRKLMQAQAFANGLRLSGRNVIVGTATS